MRFSLGVLVGVVCGAAAGAWAAGGAQVVPLAEAEVRDAPSGSATVYLLARGDNAFMGRLELDPRAQVPVHRDATEEYIHVLQGTGVITIDGVAQPLGPGATVTMPADAAVSFVNGPEQMIAIQVFAGPEPAAKYDAWHPRVPSSSP